MPALREGGVLIYSTCSYSRAEDEAIADWLTEAFEISNIKLETEQDWNVTEVQTASNNYGYRFWPNLVQGEGFFLAAFKKEAMAGSQKKRSRNVIKPVTQKLAEPVSRYADISNFELIQVKDKVYAWPADLFDEYDFLLQNLHIIYSGILLGELAHKKFIPDHALAMSLITSEHVGKVDLTFDDAITYLQKNPLSIDASGQGWHVATHKNYPMGWMNILTNRINNYYPIELRILKK